MWRPAKNWLKKEGYISDQNLPVLWSEKSVSERPDAWNRHKWTSLGGGGGHQQSSESIDSSPASSSTKTRQMANSQLSSIYRFLSMPSNTDHSTIRTRALVSEDNIFSTSISWTKYFNDLSILYLSFYAHPSQQNLPFILNQKFPIVRIIRKISQKP